MAGLGAVEPEDVEERVAAVEATTNAVSALRTRAETLYVSSIHQEAYVLGGRARLGGRPRDANPYRSSSHKRAWLLGYRSITTS